MLHEWRAYPLLQVLLFGLILTRLLPLEVEVLVGILRQIVHAVDQ